VVTQLKIGGKKVDKPTAQEIIKDIKERKSFSAEKKKFLNNVLKEENHRKKK
jgi:hypothetical protein